jgi:predicted aminopeptidase
MKLNGFFLSVFPVFASLALLILGIVLFSGCYTLKQGTTMLGYLGKAVPLEKLAVSAEKTADADTLAFVERVADIRRFAMEELGLKESKNYTGYVELDRDYLAAVVSACAADSFTRHEWTFPVVGTVPYKGFFNPEDARKEAAKLKGEGLDVWIRGVDAFSTLGWFKDPLYSYMKSYSDYQLADLIIHELLHATVFVRGQVQFNEQLAEFVGSTGARLYLETRFGKDSEEYRAIGGNTTDAAAYRAFLRELSAELEAVYGDKNLNRTEKLTKKEQIIKAAQARFAAEYDGRFQSQIYRFFVTMPVNNAYLDLYRLYYGKEAAEDNFFTGLYERLPVSVVSGSSSETGKLRIFISAAASLNKSRAAAKDPRQTLASAIERL